MIEEQILEMEVGTSSPVSSSASNTLKRKSEESSPITNKKKAKILQGMKAGELQRILQSDPIKFCQDMGLMAKAVKCPCSHDMKLSKTSITKDNFEWRCDKNGVKHHQTIRKGTWFELARVLPADILWVAYMWLHEYSLKSMLHESDLREKAIKEWCGSCLDLCQAILERKCDPLGGEQKTVEIFQCSFKQEMQEKWVFCALEQDSTKSLLIYLEDKTSDSVAQIFNKYFLPGTTVIGRVWNLFENVTEDNFESFITETSLTFYDMVTRVKMDTFKEFEKKAMQQRPGLCKLLYDEYFFENMYRKSLAFAPDAYLTFLKDVATVYKPLDVVVKRAPKPVKD